VSQPAGGPRTAGATTPPIAGPDRVGRGYDQTVSRYEGALRPNLDGVLRLVALFPDGDHRRVLDVGCGTGWSSVAFAGRFRPDVVIGVDPSPGMLRGFRERAGELGPARLELVEAEVMDMPVAAGSVDAVISTMAFHWFPDKPGALGRMAECLHPGGVLGILTGGQGVSQEYVDIMTALDPPVPAPWVEIYESGPVSERQMLGWLEDAGLTPLDVWIERRLRRAPTDEILEWMHVVGSHLDDGIPPDEVARHRARIREAMLAAEGPRGFEYHFCKLFALARAPG
jgi:SAM-dependent methyltransferase